MPDLNPCCDLILDLCATHGLVMTNTMFEYKTGFRNVLSTRKPGQRSMIDFVDELYYQQFLFPLFICHILKASFPLAVNQKILRLAKRQA